MAGMTKRQRKVLRQLAELARTREQASYLSELDVKFDQWRDGSMTGDDLNLAIHTYHQGPARDLYLRYDARGGPEVAVGLAVAQGVLSRDDIPDDLWEEVAFHAKTLGAVLDEE